MKKLLAFLMVPFLMLSLLSCFEESAAERVTRIIGIDAGDGVLLTSYDDHGGFFGDGTAYISLAFSDDDFLLKLQESGEWKPLPTDDVTARLCELITDDEGTPFFPRCKTGISVASTAKRGLRGISTAVPPIIFPWRFMTAIPAFCTMGSSIPEN